jgi:Signal peptidase, peptidase S26
VPRLQTPSALALLGLAVLLVLRRRARHVVVAGSSMRPTLEPGDRLVTLRTPGRPRVGGLALSPDPRVPERMLIKRVHAVDGDRVELRGDAASDSTDSRTFGPVPLGAVQACVAFRYHPIERAGWVRSPPAGGLTAALTLSSARVRAARPGCRRPARR